jgi:hypothetical protein
MRMGCLCDAATDGDAQAFLFEADLATLQNFPDVAVQQLRDTVFDNGIQFIILDCE